MKKGQIEMMGLVIVVVLLIIGGLLYVRFGVLGKKEVQKNTVVETAYIINTLNAVLNVKICNNEIQLQDAVSKCFEKSENICGEEACGYIKKQIEPIMTSVLINTNYKYSFYFENDEDTFNINKECEYGSKADITIVGIDGGYYMANMQLC